MEQKRYDQLSKDYVLLVVDISLYDPVPEEISIQGTTIDKNELMNMLREKEASESNAEKREEKGEERNATRDTSKSENLLKEEAFETLPQKELLAFMILTNELVRKEGAGSLIDGFKEGDLRLITEHHLTIDTIQSSPEAVLDLGNGILDDALSQMFSEQQDQDRRELGSPSRAS